MAALEAVKTERTAGFVDSGYNRRNQQRIKQEEEELEALLKLQRGEAPEEDTQDEASTAPKDEAPPTDEKGWQKRYSDLRRHTAEKDKDWQKKLDDLEARLTNTSAIVPPTSDEDLEAWIKKHPEIASIVKTLADKAANERFKDADTELQELQTMRLDAKREKAEAAIRKKHPDFDDIKEADEFHDWAEEQPKWIQDAIYENPDDPNALVRAIDLYKADKGLTQKDRKQKEKEAAGSIITKNAKPAIDSDEGGTTFSESQVNRMTDKEYEKMEEKILEAMRTGKFKYDLSGGAR
jgi:hypothetical protein